MIMKKIFSVLASLATLVFFVSCQKGDGDAEYGNALVYIPQAFTNGTIDNIYPVPSGDAENTYNFKVDGESVNVYLGVYRSGKLDGSAVKVTVAADASASSAQAAALGAKVMPGSLYSLPATAQVEAGENACTFFLTIPKSELTKPANAGQVYVLCVRISDPSAYKLNEDGSVVVVKLDVDALKALV